MQLGGGSCQQKYEAERKENFLTTAIHTLTGRQTDEKGDPVDFQMECSSTRGRERIKLPEEQ